ncbi:T9SS type A sorting domain-containing protein, partial [Bacteroidales bacterium OttesenSCG-928-I21]|nr:T9SS type A sorting domain-containing protein [Bacteroidales bacterium OttesenSCG-928-I21]
YFFSVLRPTGHIDSLVLNGNSMAWTGLVLDNYGIISNCVNNIPLTNIISGAVYGISGICSESRGIIDNCVNNADIYYDGTCTSLGAAGICFYFKYPGEIKNCINNGNIYALTNQYATFAGIVAVIHYGVEITESFNLTNCTNNGNIEVLGDTPWTIAGGICASLELCLGDTISNCVNNGNISGKGMQYAGGIIAYCCGGDSVIRCLNCINTGNISGKISAGGIVGISSFSCRVTLKNCLNSGIIEGDGVEGGFIGDINRIHTEPIGSSFVFENNLNIGKVNNTSLIGAPGILQPELEISLHNNYYDKQMSPAPATVAGDIFEQAEGKLTNQLTGTSPELQAMLGDDWSYAENRYPIPLGFENDSVILLATTPIWLYHSNENSYNTVDSVSQNFIVGLENNVQWTVVGEKVALEDNNAVLLNTGTERLVANLGDYSKTIKINISRLPESITHKISGYITSDMQAIPDITVTCGSLTTYTDYSGYYEFFVEEHSNATITPVSDDYAFTPQQTELLDITQEYANVNFAANYVESKNLTTGVSKFQIFPNPAINSINVLSQTEIESIQVFNAIGETLIEKRNTNKIDLSELKSGIYYIKINNTYVEKIIKY